MTFRFISAVALFALLVLVGCASSPLSPFSKNEYTLSPISKQEAAGGNPSAPLEATVGVTQVQLAEHLDKPEIAAAGTPKKESAPAPKWAKPLKENFSSVLAENLSLLMATKNVSVISANNPASPDYQVVVEVRKFEGEMGKEGFLDARWTILGNQGTETVFLRNSSFHQPVAGEGVKGVVGAMNQTLSDLSQEIAAALQAVSQK